MLRAQHLFSNSYTFLAQHRLTMVSVLLAMLLLLQCCQLVFMLLPKQPQWQDNATHWLNVAQTHLFGNSQQQTQAATAPSNLKLLGIFHSNTKPFSQAILLTAEGIEKVYSIGDNIQGAQIQEITQNKVVLNIAGNTQELYLPKEG